VFVGLEAAASESGDAWEEFLTGLGERGLACPLLVISDGTAGLVGAIERTMGAALRQRCLIHRARINVLAKVPKNAHADMKADYWAIFASCAFCSAVNVFSGVVTRMIGMI
jgi:putative transposase